jgi:NAD-dependent deacetylase
MKERKKVVVFTGAGISQESNIPTFRDSNGLWENHDVMDVATPQGWKKDRELVLRFYNERRADVMKAQPNPGHLALAKLEDKFDVTIITQNVDDLHERAGSTKVIHLHGTLFESRCSLNKDLVYPITKDIKIGDKSARGAQLRPNVVWFGEAVPNMQIALNETTDAEIFIVCGTSLQVYPAAQLGDNVPPLARGNCYLVDPNPSRNDNYTIMPGKAGDIMPLLVEQLLASE